MYFRNTFNFTYNTYITQSGPVNHVMTSTSFPLLVFCYLLPILQCLGLHLLQVFSYSIHLSFSESSNRFSSNWHHIHCHLCWSALTHFDHSITCSTHSSRLLIICSMILGSLYNCSNFALCSILQFPVVRSRLGTY